MRILLTGSCGYVGSALVPKLIDAGHRVFGIDVGWFTDNPLPKDVRTIKDLGDIECIIHLAAISNDPSVAYYPRLSWETTVLATQQLAQMAVKTGCRFIYASSVSVYGADRGMVTEDMDVQPLSDYNKTKMCAERVLLSYPDLHAQIIRPATICGLSPRMRLDLTVNTLTMQALTKGVMTVHGGSQMRPSIHIDDMTDLYVWMVDHPEVYGIYNAGFENHSVMELAIMVREKVRGSVIKVQDIFDKRSYKVNSDKILAAGFQTNKGVWDAIKEISNSFLLENLYDEPQHYNLDWMTHLGIKDE